MPIKCSYINSYLLQVLCSLSVTISKMFIVEICNVHHDLYERKNRRQYICFQYYWSSGFLHRPLLCCISNWLTFHNR